MTSLSALTGWMPVSDVLPSDGEHVLATLPPDESSPFPYVEPVAYKTGTWFSLASAVPVRVVAWMPYPDPALMAG